MMFYGEHNLEFTVNLNINLIIFFAHDHCNIIYEIIL